MKHKFLVKLVLIFLGAFPLLGKAGGLEQLKLFFTHARSAEASFTQQVITRSGKSGQHAAGQMQFQRPGKFRWEYTQPYSQLLIGDGERLWSYDKQLNQVVIKPMGQALGATPAALLAGDDKLDQNFTLKEAHGAEGLEWVEAIPKNKEAGFERVMIGLRDGLPQAMDVLDNFGQTTYLRFADFKRNPDIPASRFNFVVPRGADVIGG